VGRERSASPSPRSCWRPRQRGHRRHGHDYSHMTSRPGSGPPRSSSRTVTGQPPAPARPPAAP
jgi:hypothetical protein